MSKIRLNSAAVGFICYLIRDFSTSPLLFSKEHHQLEIQLLPSASVLWIIKILEEKMPFPVLMLCI